MSEFLKQIPQGITSGEINVADSATQLSDIDCQMVMIQAYGSNTGDIFIGGASVTAPDGTADTTSGILLEAGDISPWIPCSNLNQLYAIAATDNDDLIYFCIL